MFYSQVEFMAIASNERNIRHRWYFLIQATIVFNKADDIFQFSIVYVMSGFGKLNVLFRNKVLFYKKKSTCE